MAMAVKAQIPKVIWISFARGSKLTVTTEMMATRKPSEVYVSDAAVLWYKASEMAVGMDPLYHCQSLYASCTMTNVELT
jgi:hypothetical protein